VTTRLRTTNHLPDIADCITCGAEFTPEHRGQYQCHECQPLTTDAFIDRLVSSCTAFPTLAAMADAMYDAQEARQGYVPTISPETRRKRLLRAVLHANGWNVHPAYVSGE